jgi:hypothetical protein
MNKFRSSLLIVVVGTAMALMLAHCSGCVLVIPEGEAGWDSEPTQEEALP